jgi:COP9 signalosome complex subunit 4
MQHKSLIASELEALLQQATICAVLSTPGPSRSRLLEVLMRDPRTSSLPTCEMVAKLQKGHFITPQDVRSFSALLQHDPAKLATDSEGLNDVQKAARLHNLAAVGRVYRNISFQSLGGLLGVPADAAEDLAANMIAEDRLHGSIDQISGTLEFTKSADPLHTWQGRLVSANSQIAAVSERIVSKHPSLLPAGSAASK